MPEDYYLSSENPIANIDQRDLEALALRLCERPEVQKARAVATALWRNVVAHPAREQMSRFENMIDEYVFHYALRGANSDGWNPRILRIMAPKGRWFGHNVPGSRWGGDSPDFIYRMIPIAYGARYEIRGQTTCDPPPSTTYSLMSGNAAAPSTMSLLDSLDMQSGESGEFVITIDPTPAEGRVNHLQTKPGADHLLIRDALGDWLLQTPNRLRVRLLDTSDRAPLTEAERAQHAARSIADSLYYTYYLTQSGSGQPPNDLRVPASSAPFGGMPTQWGTKGNLYLKDDEALIVTANAAGALFRNVGLCDLFFMSMSYWSHTTGLNMSQMAPDADGRFTFVVAHQDPGVHNWLDTRGLRRTIFGHRWQAIPRGPSQELPTISTRLVKFADLDNVVADGVRRMDARARQEQLARRTEGFNRRFVDS
jgi:hypothetical protein